MNNASESDKETISRLNGLYVGQLSDDEMESFVRCKRDGIARCDYGSLASAMLGIPKVLYVGD